MREAICDDSTDKAIIGSSVPRATDSALDASSREEALLQEDFSKSAKVCVVVAKSACHSSLAFSKRLPDPSVFFGVDGIAGGDLWSIGAAHGCDPPERVASA